MHRLFRWSIPFVLSLACLSARPAMGMEVTENQADTIPHYAAPTTEFFAAAVHGDVHGLEQAMAEGVSPDATVPLPLTPEMAELFTPRSRGGRLLNDPGATALMLAVAAGQADTMKFLLDAKANREARTRSGMRPLDIAAERQDITAMQTILGVTPDSEAAKLSIVVDLSSQEAKLLRDGQTVMVTKVSSGKKEKPTPPGRYVVTQKYTDWRSTLYHNASMPFFLRLSCGAVGLHAGVIPGYPASHGCVRLPKEVAQKFYQIVPKGTLVTIQ